MTTDIILDLLSEELKVQAFKSCLERLRTAQPLDLETLRVCIKLRPSEDATAKPGSSVKTTQSASPFSASQDQEDASATARLVEKQTLNASLCDLLLVRIPHEKVDSNHLYRLAEILCSDGPFAHLLFRNNINKALAALVPQLSGHAHDEHVHDDHEPESNLRQAARTAASYLTLIKCSYWLPSDRSHIIDQGSLELLSRFVGLTATTEIALEAISAFLSLLKRGEPVVVAPTTTDTESWLRFESSTGQVVLSGSIIDSSLWDQLTTVELSYQTKSKQPSMVFRAWFQWISQAVIDDLQLDCLQNNLYWERLRTGLLYGHADQRKYCIGIIRQSLLAAQRDIDTDFIRYCLTERVAYLKAFEQYSALFETIVLDRYANQVQACLPELTKLLEAKLTPMMISTLLSAALSPMVQDGVRKLVGNWYMEHVIKIQGNIEGHLQFLLDGFLPWATTGELFTTTVVATRESTVSVHGMSLSNLIARFVYDSQVTTRRANSRESNSPVVQSAAVDRRAVIIGVLDFILDSEGKMFQFSILYLLEGLVKGLQMCAEDLPLGVPLTSAEIDKISRISRLPGLPEIAGDLYREYCAQICDLTSSGWRDIDMLAYQQILHGALKLTTPVESRARVENSGPRAESPMTLQDIRNDLESSHHHCIQGENFAIMCKKLTKILDRTDSTSISYSDLYLILDAFWEETDRRQFIRPVAIHIPRLLFHPTCAQVCIAQQSELDGATSNHDLSALLLKALDRLQSLAEGRIYILSTLAMSVRRAVLAYPELIGVLQLETYILHFLNNPPTIKSEFLFEVIAAEKLQQTRPHRSYKAYYGSREWYAYAAIFDLLQHFPEQQTEAAKRVFDSLLEPWKNQRPGAPIISRWKNVLQLQAMLLLVDFCVPLSDADTYLTYLRHALTLEAWPRYRFLLEWITARIYNRCPGKASQILEDFSKLDENSSTHIASLMKLAVLVAPLESENFSVTYMNHLTSLAASPKVQIRHESNYAIPIIFDLASSRNWKRITDNPPIRNLDGFIRSLDKFQATPWTIRTLKLDAVDDFTLVNIIQGQYLTIESPEKARVAYEDFIALHEDDRMSGVAVPPERIPLGEPLPSKNVTDNQVTRVAPQQAVSRPTGASPTFFQTKSGFDLSSLHPHAGPPSEQNQRPASVILVASLIENCTNVGGLSRVAESFGLEALYIGDLRQTAHKDFKATSVTSEKHFPIHELKAGGVPDFLIAMKRNGYVAVGIEQTDQSSILGTEDTGNASLGILPRKCVLVLGSEKGGITAEVLAALDRCVEIRTVGVTRSLNVQTAGGIALYEWWRKWYGKH
ncbi:hypothetical protein HBI47_158740 [Parastagonospora nodorum]|nr:hypothetical protein HBI47_158740 [Parastagonospora nodorum]